MKSTGPYKISVRTTDAGGLTHDKGFSICDPVSATSSFKAPTAVSLSTSSVAENQSSGTTVGTLSTTDDAHTYSLVSGDGSTDNDQFSITGSTLLTGASFDYETKTSYSIRGRTSDSAGAHYEGELTITVTDVNEAPTAISLIATTVSLPSSGTSAGTLSSTDVDSGDSHTCSLSSGSSNFQISSSTLQTASSLSAGSYSVTVRSTDSGGLTFDQSFTVTVKRLSITAKDTALIPGDSDSITVTFDSTPNVGSGYIYIYNPDGSVFETFDVTSSKISISGNVLTIDPGTNRVTDIGNYYVLIDSAAISDFAGISSTSTWQINVFSP
ncbi:MAG: cadherin repeat domain-containing protein [SAR324 cluster bacterium]|nr:cadherin repeat domain-containing protein [SAR324 cluster bacterium]